MDNPETLATKTNKVKKHNTLQKTKKKSNMYITKNLEWTHVPYFVPGINQFHFCICFHVCVQCCDVCYDFLVKQYSALHSYASSHWKLTCSRYDIPENLLNWRYATITHSLKICWLGAKQQSLTQRVGLEQSGAHHHLIEN